jgi:hypothetical protein
MSFGFRPGEKIMRRTFALGCLVASAQCFATSTLSLHLRASARQMPLTAPTMCTAPRTDGDFRDERDALRCTWRGV